MYYSGISEHSFIVINWASFRYTVGCTNSYIQFWREKYLCVFLMFNCSSKAHITLFIGCFHTQHGNLSTYNANIYINESYSSLEIPNQILTSGYRGVVLHLRLVAFYHVYPRRTTSQITKPLLTSYHCLILLALCPRINPWKQHLQNGH